MWGTDGDGRPAGRDQRAAVRYVEGAPEIGELELRIDSAQGAAERDEGVRVEGELHGAEGQGEVWAVHEADAEAVGERLPVGFASGFLADDDVAMIGRDP